MFLIQTIFLITTNDDQYLATTFEKNPACEAADLQNDSLQLTIIHFEGYWQCGVATLFVVSVRCYYSPIVGTNFSVTQMVFKREVSKTRKMCNCTNFWKVCDQNKRKSKLQYLFSQYQSFFSLLTSVKCLNCFPDFHSAQSSKFNSISDTGPWYTIVTGDYESIILIIMECNLSTR